MYRSRIGIHCLPTCCSHDAHASVMVGVFLFDDHSAWIGQSGMSQTSMKERQNEWLNGWISSESLASHLLLPVRWSGLSNDIIGRSVPDIPAPRLQTRAPSAGHLQCLLLAWTVAGHWGLYSTIRDMFHYIIEPTHNVIYELVKCDRKVSLALTDGMKTHVSADVHRLAQHFFFFFIICTRN